ncbi:MAG: hypothetical protein V1685_02740, partial [Parcubacteria group bacterium]
MATGTDVDLGPRILFTEPWEPLVVRRGDALGLRALADQFAGALAPDLNNRINDGRWVTILAWCLLRSQEVFHASGGSSVVTRDQQRERYAWLRPLELMWVARTITLLAEDGGWKNRPIAGRQRVRPWVDNQTMDRFGMSVEQFRAYRQTGMYGGYRLAFRKWPEMTISGDGWTPGRATNDLAKWLDDKLGKAARPPRLLHADRENGFSTSSAKRGKNKEDHWWCKKWPNFDKRGRDADENTLPRPKNEFDKQLPELDLLKPLVFGKDQNGRKRLEIACEVAHSKANKHIDICEYLARKFASDPAFKLLPMFSRLADAGMEVMDLVAKSLKNEPCVKLADVAGLPEVKNSCKELMVAAQEWRKNSDGKLRHIETAHRFVKAIASGQPTECLPMLLKYHEDYGGGLRWFVLRNGTVEL